MEIPGNRGTQLPLPPDGGADLLRRQRIGGAFRAHPDRRKDAQDAVETQKGEDEVEEDALEIGGAPGAEQLFVFLEEKLHLLEQLLPLCRRKGGPQRGGPVAEQTEQLLRVAGRGIELPLPQLPVQELHEGSLHAGADSLVEDGRRLRAVPVIPGVSHPREDGIRPADMGHGGDADVEAAELADLLLRQAQRRADLLAVLF